MVPRTSFAMVMTGRRTLAPMDLPIPDIDADSALLEVGHFPPLMLHMIASGEASGELDNMLARIAQQQEMEIERLVTTAVRLFEPLMLVLMGVVVLTIVMSILMPIMEMNNMVGQ